MSEQVQQQKHRLYIQQTYPTTRIYRNNVGSLPNPKTKQYVHYGLCKGSSDLIGWKTVKITPDMVGQDIAVFTALEVKTESGKPTPEQVRFIDDVKKAGGIATIIRNNDDIDKVLK